MMMSEAAAGKLIPFQKLASVDGDIILTVIGIIGISVLQTFAPSAGP